MSAFVAYPGWDESGVAAAFSKPILGYLRDPLGFKGLVVTDAFIMGGATAVQSEGPAAVAALTAGGDALLCPADWEGGGWGVGGGGDPAGAEGAAGSGGAVGQRGGRRRGEGGV